MIIVSTQPWALAPKRPVEAPLTPFRATDYANGLETYFSQIELVANKLPEGSRFDSSTVGHAIFDLGSRAREFENTLPVLHRGLASTFHGMRG